MRFDPRDALAAGLGLLLGMVSCLVVVAWPGADQLASNTQSQSVVGTEMGGPTTQVESPAARAIATDTTTPSAADAQLDADAVMERLTEQYEASGSAAVEVRENESPNEQPGAIHGPSGSSRQANSNGEDPVSERTHRVTIADRRLIGVWARERNGVPEALEFRDDGTYRFMVDMAVTEGSYALSQSAKELRLTLSTREGGSLQTPVVFPHDNVLLCDPRGGGETGVRPGEGTIVLRSSRYVFRRGTMATVSDARAATDRRRSEWKAWVQPESPDDLLIVSPPDSRRGIQISHPANRFYLTMEPGLLPRPDDQGVVRISKGGEEELFSRQLDGRLLATSRDGRVLAMRPAKHSAEVWDLQEERRIALIRSSLNAITSVHLSDSGQHLIVVAGDNLACCELSPPRLIAYRKFRDVEGVALSSDGTMLAAGISGGRCQVWQLADLSLLIELSNENPDSPRIERDHLQGIPALDFSPDGTRFALGSDNGALRLWRTSDWSPQGTRDLGYAVQRVQFSPHGAQLYAAAVDGPQSKMTVWNVEQGLTPRTPTWEAGGIGPQALSPILHGVAVEPSPDGRLAAVPVFHSLRRGRDYLELQIVEALTGRQRTVLRIGDDSRDPPIDHRLTLAFDPSGNLLAVNFAERPLWLMDIPRKRRVMLIQPGADAVAFAGPNSQWLAVAARDGTVELHAIAHPGL